MAKHEQPSEKGGKAAKGKSQEAPESPETTSPTAEGETNDAALKESAEKAIENFENAAEQEADQKEKAAPAVTLEEISVEDGVVYRNYSDGTKQEFAPSQAEAYLRHTKIEWDNEGDKAAAEAISRYAFGQSKEQFEEAVNDFSPEEKKKLIKIAKKLDMAEIVNAKVLRHIEEEEEKED